MYAKHTASASQALYNVFVLPALAETSVPQTTYRHAISKQPFMPLVRRSLHQSHMRPAKTRAAEARTQKWNEEITSRLIQLVDSETNRLLDEGRPRAKRDILNRIDLKTHRLVQLSPEEPGNRDFIPLCKIVCKKASYEAELRRKKAARDHKRTHKLVGETGAKTLELNWAIDPNHDLLHRLDRMRRFLAEGRRVDVVLASRKGGRKATTEECERVLDKIRAAAAAVEGIREKEPFRGKLGGFGQMSFQTSKPVVKPQEKDGNEEEEEEEVVVVVD